MHYCINGNTPEGTGDRTPKQKPKSSFGRRAIANGLKIEVCESFKNAIKIDSAPSEGGAE